MAKSNSIKRQNSTSEKKSLEDDEILDYPLAYAYQNNNNNLQRTEGLMIEELITALSTSSQVIKKWETDWHKTINNNKKSTGYINMWDLLNAVVSSVNVLTDDIDEKLTNLRSIQSSIPNQKNQKSLKNEVKQARSVVDKLDEEIKDQEKQKKKLNKGSWSNKIRSKVFGTSQKDPTEKLIEVSTSIKHNKRLLRKETLKFNRKAEEIIETNKKPEIERIRSMKKRLTRFVGSFGERSDEFNDALGKCKPEEDVSKWGNSILRQKCEESDEFSDEEETSDTEKYSRQQSTKFRSSEKGNRDKKTNPPLVSAKSLPAENEKNDETKLTRQSSVQPASVKDKKRDKKSNKNQESFDSISAEVEEVNKTE